MTTKPLSKFLSLAALSFCLVKLGVAEEFRLSTRPLLIPELGEATGSVIQVATNLFSFLPPPKWQVLEDKAERKVNLNRPGGDTRMWFRFIASTNITNDLKIEVLRERIQKAFPGSKIQEEFSCVSGIGTGPAFDIVRGPTNGPPQSFELTSRLVFLPTAGGFIEFCLVTPPNRFSKDHFVFGNLLNSFHAETNISR